MPDAIGRGESRLRCRLSNDELFERQELLVKKTGTRGILEGDLEVWKGRKRTEQKELEGEITVIGAECVRLAVAIRDGEELRTVKVEYWLDAAQVNTVRLDTGEVVSSRPAQQHEMQRELELPGAEPENEATHAGELEEEPTPRPEKPAEGEEGAADAEHDLEWG